MNKHERTMIYIMDIYLISLTYYLTTPSLPFWVGPYFLLFSLLTAFLLNHHAAQATNERRSQQDAR